MNKFRLFYGILGLLLVLGCTQAKVHSIEELEQVVYNPTDEFKQTVIQGEYEFTLLYQPVEFLLLGEYKYLNQLQSRNASQTQIELQKEQIVAYRSSFEGLIQYKLIITPTSDNDLVYGEMSRGFDAYSRWLQKLLFGIQKEIQIVLTDGTEVPLMNYQMDRNYGTSTSRTFLLTFPREVNGQEIGQGKFYKLEIGEFGLGTGKVLFKQTLPLPTITLENTHDNA